MRPCIHNIVTVSHVEYTKNTKYMNIDLYQVSYKQVVPTVAYKLSEKTVLPFCIPTCTKKI